MRDLFLNSYANTNLSLCPKINDSVISYTGPFNPTRWDDSKSSTGKKDNSHCMFTMTNFKLHLVSIIIRVTVFINELQTLKYRKF